MPLRVKRIHLKKIAARLKRSVEEAGRIERYRFFEAAAGRTRCGLIATAHTLDDQAETVLMRIVRGSGIKGLSGIPHKRGHGRFQLIRPFLDIEKKDLLSFLRKNRVRFCEDRTNRDRSFSRNRVRHGLLRLLEAQYNPHIKKMLANLQLISHETYDYLHRVSVAAFRKCVARGKSGDPLRVDMKKLSRLHPAIQREVLLRALEAKRGDLKRLEFSHLAAIGRLLRSESAREPETHLPGRVRVRKKSKWLEIWA